MVVMHTWHLLWCLHATELKFEHFKISIWGSIAWGKITEVDLNKTNKKYANMNVFEIKWVEYEMYEKYVQLYVQCIYTNSMFAQL